MEWDMYLTTEDFVRAICNQDDCNSIELSELDIYNYIGARTKEFDVCRVKILLEEMTRFHLLTIQEERIDIINKKIDDGWRDVKTKEIIINEEQTLTIDYEDAFKKVFGLFYDDMYNYAISILKSKIPHQEKAKHNKTPLEQVYTDCPRAKKYFERAIGNGLITETETGLHWNTSIKADLAYFLIRIYDRDGQRGRIPGKQIERIFNVKNIHSAINLVPHDKKRPHIDKLFKD